MAEETEIIVPKELLGRSADELESLMNQKVDALHAAKFKNALGQLDKPHTMKQLRRDIARLKTVLTEKSKA